MGLARTASPPRRAGLAARLAEVAGHALSTRQVITPIEVLAGVGWLPATQVESWRRGRIPCLERVAGANLAKLNPARRLLADWAQHDGLTPSETVYVTWTRDCGGPRRVPHRLTRRGRRIRDRARHGLGTRPAMPIAVGTSLLIIAINSGKDPTNVLLLCEP
jgi:hypothetical protein